MTEKLTCYKHPDRETLLRCGRCDRPICADCVHHGATGVRCEDCVSLSPRERGQADRRQLQRAAIAACLVALPGGALLGAVGMITLITSAVLGFGVGTAALLAAEKHRGPLVQGIAGSAALLGVLLGAVVSSFGVPGMEGDLGRVLVNVSFSDFFEPCIAAIVGALVRFAI